MEKIPDIHMSEVVFGSADKKLSAQISKLQKLGKIRKIAPRVYTSNLTDEVEVIIRRNLFIILDHLYPGALISHRSAFEFAPTEDGHFFLTYKYTKKKLLPGLSIRLLKGPEPMQGDYPFSTNLFASQQARAFLENLQLSKRPGGTSKTLTIPEVEEKLEEIVRIKGEEELNSIREKARQIASSLDMKEEFKKLDLMISALLNTHDVSILSSPIAAARALGFPYDPARIELFQKLFTALKSKEFEYRPDRNTSKQSFRNFAFYESYFSNYIEGTVFDIEEARNIIKTNQPLPTRNEDSHDILGTYRIVSNKQEMSITPSTSSEFLSILQKRHAILLSARTDKNPGLFKDRNNFAGQTAFVDFNLVKGTLIKGFDLYNALLHPFARAAFMMFAVSEIHPFLDGNGRLARIMMNAELVAGGQSKIIIPTVFRDDYLGVLRKLTRQQNPDPYIKMLLRAFEYSSLIYSESMREMHQQFEKSNSFLEPTEGKLKINVRT